MASDRRFQLSFKTAYFARIGTATLSRCIYDPIEKKEITDRCAEELYLAVACFSIQNRFEGLIASLIAHGVVTQLSTVLKNDAFHHEDEWRLTVPALSVPRPLVSYRASESMVIPYIKVPISKTSDCLHHIMIGPSPHPESNREAIVGMLGGESERNRVTVSTIPYRAW